MDFMLPYDRNIEGQFLIVTPPKNRTVKDAKIRNFNTAR